MSRTFLGWDTSLIGAVVDRLTRDWDGQGALDLTDHLILVPTRNASRRLREALALRAAEHDAAVLPPLVVTPDFLTSPERVPDLAPAGRVETLLIWAAELMRLDLDDYRQLFPTDPVERGFAWALKAAGDLLELRETLNENGLSLADAARRLAGTEMEPERWDDLARLEKLCLRATEARGLADWQEARRRAAAQSRPPENITRVVMAGVLDPSALAVIALERWAASMPVEVQVYAPEATHADGFDTWGRPVPEKWLERPIDIPVPAATLHAAAGPGEQAETAAGLLAAHEEPGAVGAVGVADSEVVVPLEKALEARGLGGFDPAGKRLATHGVVHLLRTLSDLAASRSFQAFTELLRCSDVAETVSRRVEEKTGHWRSLRAMLNDLDTLATEALPDTLDDALALAPRVLDTETSAVPEALAWVNTTLKSLEGDDFGGALSAFLGEVFGGRTFRSDDPQYAVFSTVADAVTGALDALEGPAAADFPGGIGAAQRLELLLLSLEDETFNSEREPHDIDLQGWLELLWEDAPHLVITGMNDGKAPESILGHVFLPDSTRRVLGLRNNDTRFARDACLMTTLIESRRAGGRVDFIFGRTTGSGDPLRPSRLLLQCGTEDLPARALQLFESPARAADPVPWGFAWRLRPEPLPDEANVFHKLSVTQFRGYLACPFRFYLSAGLKMQSVEAGAAELDAAGFGTLIHAVLEDFASDPAAAALTEADAIRKIFDDRIEHHVAARYGTRLTVPLMIQQEAARQRLGWWAEIEAEQRRAGWRIEVAETSLTTKDDPWVLDGVTIRGRIDRIERHPQRGIRLIDFKTASLASPSDDPGKAARDHHLAALKKSDDPAAFPEWSLVDPSAEKPLRWIDLQLPLYALGMERRFPGETITTALASLGRAKNTVGLHPWEDLDETLLASARACAGGVIAAIRGRRFWPPAESVAYDNFEHLFFGEVLDAVDPTLLIGKEAA